MLDPGTLQTHVNSNLPTIEYLQPETVGGSIGVEALDANTVSSTITYVDRPDEVDSHLAHIKGRGANLRKNAIERVDSVYMVDEC